jgi:hypothetical protein
MVKYMQVECERLIHLLNKHDPIKDMETKLEKMHPKDPYDLDSSDDEAQ